MNILNFQCIVYVQEEMVLHRLSVALTLCLGTGTGGPRLDSEFLNRTSSIVAFLFTLKNRQSVNHTPGYFLFYYLTTTVFQPLLPRLGLACCLHSLSNSQNPLPLPVLTRGPLSEAASHKFVARHGGESVDPQIVEPVSCTLPYVTTRHHSRTLAGRSPASF